MCNDYRAVAHVSVSITPDNGYYILVVFHRHKGAEKPLMTTFRGLSWEELGDVVERVLDDNRPDFRHHALLPEQSSLTF